MLLRILKKVLLAVVVFITLAAALFLIAPQLMDNYFLDSFACQLIEADMPDDTYIVESAAICGKLYGTNGEHLDFLACALIKSGNSIEVLQKHFTEMEFVPAKKESKKYGVNLVKVEVKAVNETELVYSNLEHENIIFQNLKGITDFSGYYTVVILDDGYY